MKKRPWIVKAITVSLFAVPLITGLVVFLAKQKRPGIILGANIITDVWLLCVGCVIVGFGVWRVRPWGFFTMLILGLIIIGADAQHVISNPATLNAWDFVDVIMVATAFALITRKHVREPYFNPKIRWWERPERHRVSLQGFFDIQGKSTESPILDISTGGCFVDFQTPVADGEVLILNLEFNNFKFRTQAKVVRHSQNPKGIGLMFVETEKNHRREIKKIVRDLERSIAA